MSNFIIYIICGSLLLIALAIVAICKRCRKVEKARENDIVHHIRIQDRLAKELEYVNIEKKALEKLLESKFDVIVLASNAKKRKKEKV